MFLAIDPSINHVGCCIVDHRGNYTQSLTFNTKGNSSTEKLEHLSSQWPLWLKTHSPQISAIIIEHTRFFARNNNRSHASAQKLNLAKGVIFGICRTLRPDTPTHLIWIPGFNKIQAQLLSRAFKCPKNLSQHELDAFWLANQWANATPQQREQLLQTHLDK